MKRLIILALVALLAGLSACRESSSGLITGTGTLRGVGGECTGIWLLRSDAGRVYELTVLAEEFQQQELRVRFKLKPRSDYVSACMIGAGADVVAMTKL